MLKKHVRTRGGSELSEALITLGEGIFVVKSVGSFYYRWLSNPRSFCDGLGAFSVCPKADLGYF